MFFVPLHRPPPLIATLARVFDVASRTITSTVPPTRLLLLLKSQSEKCSAAETAENIPLAPPPMTAMRLVLVSAARAAHRRVGWNNIPKKNKSKPTGILIQGLALYPSTLGRERWIISWGGGMATDIAVSYIESFFPGYYHGIYHHRSNNSLLVKIKKSIFCKFRWLA